MIGRILPFFGIALALAIFFGYVSPTFSGAIASTNQDIKNYDSALAASAQFAQKENALLAARNALSPDSLTRLNTYLPDGVDNVQLILDLDALAARSGVQLSNFKTQDESAAAGTDATAAPGATATTPATDPGALPTGTTVTVNGLGSAGTTDSLLLSVSATGTYSAFRTFLEGTEQSLRPLDLINLTVTDSATGVYTYQMTYRIYWLH